MGRQEVAAVSADSSPSSGESSFRELDDVFLQNQTRIWLGEVLNTRLDEDLHISDLLQDGELLFEVSKVVWNLLLEKCVELRHFKHKQGPFGSKKSSGRYRPYSNVDLFLKMCKILGLNGIDLFSPSDVVEKRDIRKVCICIRALSRKARSKQLSVPDFDVVVYTIAMSTDMVGGIRRSLESSQCSLSGSCSYSSHKGSRTKLKQKNLYALSDRNDDSRSEESDEAESRYIEEESFSSSANKFDATGELHRDFESSPGAYLKVGQYVERPNVLQSDIKCPYIEEFEHGQQESTCSIKPIKLPSSENVGNDHLLDKMSSNCTKIDRVDISDINFALENDDSVVEDSSSISGDGRNYISDYLAFSDLIVHTTDGSSPLFFDEENNLFDFFSNVDSQELTSKKRSAQNELQSKYSDDEDMEVSSTTSMSSMLGRMLNLDFDDQFDADDSSTTNVYVDDSSSTNYNTDNSSTMNVYSSGSMDIEADKQDRESFVFYEDQKTDKFENPPCTSPEPELRHKSLDVSTELLSSSQHECRLSTHDDDTCYASESGNQDKIERNMEAFAENISDGNKATSSELPPVKHGRKQLLKAVVKGTALVGVLFFLLHIRSRGDNTKETKPLDQTQKLSSSKFSSTKQRKEGRMSGKYPAEKLKFGN